MTTMRAKPPLPSPLAARSAPLPIESEAGPRARAADAGGSEASSLPAQIEVRWCCTAPACAGLLESPSEQFAIHDLADFIIRLDIKDDSRGEIEASILIAGHCRVLLATGAVRLLTHEREGWRHIDAMRDDRAILQLSWRDGELRFAQTTLLAEAGLRGGTYALKPNGHTCLLSRPELSSTHPAAAPDRTR